MKKFLFSLSLIFTICFISCKNLFVLDNLDTGSVSVQLPGAYSERKIGEQQEDANSIEYTVDLKSKSKDYAEEKNGKPGDSISFEKLVPGKYTVSIKYESNLFLMSGETEVSVIAGKTADAKVTLKDTAVFSDPHVIIEQSSEYGIKFTIKRLPEDMDKYWGSPRIMNQNYGVGLETVSKEADTWNELVYYWPFAEKGKKYVFSLENSRGDEWITSKISVVYKEESTKYKLNIDQLNYYFDNAQIKVNKNENEYTLSFDGIEKGFEHKIFDNFEVTEGWVDTEYWVSNSIDSLLEKYISVDYYDFQTNLHNRDYDVSGLLNYYCGYSYGYKYSSLNVRPNFWSETFENQVFYLDQIITNTFDVNLPLKNRTEHFMAERVDNGIKITIFKDENYDYDTYDWNFMRILNWDNNYSFVFDKSITDVIKENGSYSFIWPLSYENENVHLELQYFLDTPESYHPCLCEYLTVISGNGTSYTPGKYYDNGNMFTIDDDDTGVNSKRILKINVPYEQITQRIPKNVVSGSLIADLSIEGSSHKDPFIWDDTRNGIINFTGSFNKLFEKSEPVDGDLSYYISQLFTDGFDIAGIHPYWWNKGPELFAKLQGRYIIPNLTIYFKIQNNDALGQFAVMNQTGVVNNTKLKHPNVYAEECDEGIKFTVTKTSENFNDVGIKDINNDISIKNWEDDFKKLILGNSFELIDRLVKKDTTYKFSLTGEFGDSSEWRVDDEIIEFTYKGDDKGFINDEIYQQYKNLKAKIEYYGDNNDIVLKVYGGTTEMLSNIVDFFEIDKDVCFQAFIYNESKQYCGGMVILNSQFNDLINQDGINLAEFSSYGGYWNQEPRIDLISMLKENNKTYFDFELQITTTDDVKYFFPSLTNMWFDNEDCFVFNEYPNNMAGFITADNKHIDIGRGYETIIYQNYQGISFDISDDTIFLDDENLFYIFEIKYEEEGNIYTKYYYGVPSDVN